MRNVFVSISAILLATAIATSVRACEPSVFLAGGPSALVIGQGLVEPPTVIVAQRQVLVQRQFAARRQVVAQRQVIVQRPQVVVRPLVARPLIVPRRAIVNPLIIVH